MQATADLLTWADEHGIEWDKQQHGATGESWKSRVEIYYDGPDGDPDMNKWETELAFKVADR